MARAKNWKESEQARKLHKLEREQKQKELKPFEVRHYQFYPCAFSDSRKKGLNWYLQIRDWKGILQLEVNSPRFKSVEDCKAFTEGNKAHRFVVG